MLQYNNCFNLVAAFLLLVLLANCHTIKNYSTIRLRFYVRMIWVTLIYTLTDILSVLAIRIFPDSHLIGKYILSLLCVSSMNLISPLYYAFIYCFTHNEVVILKRNWIISIFFILVVQILIWTSPWTKLIVYYDLQNVYQYGKFRWLFIPYNIGFMLSAIIQMIIRRRYLKTYQRSAAIFYLLAIASSGMFQFLYPQYLIIGIACAISLVLVLLTMMNPVRYKNLQTGTLSRMAFTELLLEDNRTKPGSAIIIHIQNTRRIKDLFGLDNAYYIFQQYMEKITGICENAPLFYLFDNTYAITFKKKFVARVYSERIKKFLELPFPVKPDQFSGYTITYPIYLKVYAVNNFDYIAHPDSGRETSVADSFNFINSIIHKTGDDRFFSIEQGDIALFQKQIRIKQIVARAIADESFEAYLQPIWNPKRKCFTAAESLIRLKDDEGNFIPPVEFVPLSEQNGDILRIGDIILAKTCEFIKLAGLQDLGIEKVNVNLSMVQVMATGIVSRVISILNRYSIPKELITIEVTETMAASNEVKLRDTIKEFKDSGFTIALDDFGTGFSNVSKMLNYSFDEIKFDKSLVDIVPEKMQSVAALMEICKAKGMITLAEGVESEIVATKINSLNCDLIQGFYYAKPMPRLEFVEFLREKNSLYR